MIMVKCHGKRFLWCFWMVNSSINCLLTECNSQKLKPFFTVSPWKFAKIYHVKTRSFHRMDKTKRLCNCDWKSETLSILRFFLVYGGEQKHSHHSVSVAHLVYFLHRELLNFWWKDSFQKRSLLFFLFPQLIDGIFNSVRNTGKLLIANFLFYPSQSFLFKCYGCFSLGHEVFLNTDLYQKVFKSLTPSKYHNIPKSMLKYGVMKWQQQTNPQNMLVLKSMFPRIILKLSRRWRQFLSVNLTWSFKGLLTTPWKVALWDMCLSQC